LFSFFLRDCFFVLIARAPSFLVYFSVVCFTGFAAVMMLRCEPKRRQGQIMDFKLVCDYVPQGDQPQAIEQLVRALDEGVQHQVLLGVTGSGKTFTMAAVIERINRPVLVMAHNKTLAAQLYQEFRSFFPHNATEYFVSYYDYYQPEAYIPSTDTYIE